MKKQLYTTFVITALLASSSALAESIVTKPATRIDFNQIIEENDSVRKNLHDGLDRAADKPAAQAVGKKDDKAKAIDFIDVEIGVGQSPSVVDRRYDSVGEPLLIPDPATEWIKVAVLKVFSKIP